MDKLRLFVYKADSGVIAAQWNTSISSHRTFALKNCDVSWLPEGRNQIEVISELIGSCESDYALLVASDIWLGTDIVAVVEDLISQANTLYKRWGACSVKGTRWDGEHVFNYLRAPPVNPDHGVIPHPVISVSGSVLLLNLAALRAAEFSLPPIKLGTASNVEWEVVLSVELLASEFVLLADRRLTAVVSSQADSTSEQALELIQYAGVGLSRYLSTRLINTSYPACTGWLKCDGAAKYGYLQIDAPQAKPSKLIDINAAYTSALRTGRREVPTISIIIRTQYSRPSMLERTLSAINAATIGIDGMCNVEVVVISDRTAEQAATTILRVKEFIAATPVRFEHVAVPSQRFSRVELLLQGIRRAQGDYIWFVDDDDFIYPYALAAFARSAIKGAETVFLGNAAVFDEEWRSIGDKCSPEQDHQSELTAFSYHDSFGGISFFKNFSGENYTPICGIIMPRAPLLARLEGVKALGDYLEDYFMLTKLMTAPKLEALIFSQRFAGISHRKSHLTSATMQNSDGNPTDSPDTDRFSHFDNAVSQSDRSKWHYSYATFFQEIYADKKDTSPLWWQIGKRVQ